MDIDFKNTVAKFIKRALRLAEFKRLEGPSAIIEHDERLYQEVLKELKDKYNFNGEEFLQSKVGQEIVLNFKVEDSQNDMVFERCQSCKHFGYVINKTRESVCRKGNFIDGYVPIICVDFDYCGMSSTDRIHFCINRCKSCCNEGDIEQTGSLCTMNLDDYSVGCEKFREKGR